MTISRDKRLIVSLDLSQRDFPSSLYLNSEVLRLSQILNKYKDKVIIKLNSAIHVCGYSLIEDVQNWCHVFADLKFFDTAYTLKVYAEYLKACPPAMLTAMSTADIGAIKGVLPDTIALGVSIPTDMSEEAVCHIYRCSYSDAVVRLGLFALKNGADGLIASPFDVELLRKEFGKDIEIVCPAIRPTWYTGSSSHVGTMTPANAIRVGATRVIVGRPITEAKNIKVAVETILGEIEYAM